MKTVARKERELLKYFIWQYPRLPMMNIAKITAGKIAALKKEAVECGRCLLEEPTIEIVDNPSIIETRIFIRARYVYVGRRRVKNVAFCDGLRESYKLEESGVLPIPPIRHFIGRRVTVRLSPKKFGTFGPKV